MQMEAAQVAAKTAVMVEKLVKEEVARIERENSRVSMLLERDKMIDRRCHPYPGSRKVKA